MQAQYKVYLDGERRPSNKGTSAITPLLDKYVDPAQRAKVIAMLSKGEQVEHTNRRSCCRIVLTNTALKVKVKAVENVGFLRVKLQGIQTTPQIKVAAADALKSPDGLHRVVVMVEANGLEYKVKCQHKAMSYAECVYQCVVTTRRAL